MDAVHKVHSLIWGQDIQAYDVCRGRGMTIQTYKPAVLLNNIIQYSGTVMSGLLILVPFPNYSSGTVHKQMVNMCILTVYTRV